MLCCAIQPSGLAQALVFGDMHDNSLRNAAKNNKRCEDVLAYPSAKEILNEVDCHYANEKVTPPDATQANTHSSTATSSATPTATTNSMQQMAEQSSKPEGFESLDVDTQDKWLAHADKELRQHVSLLVIPSSRTALEAELVGNDIAHTKGDVTGLVMFHYDVKLSGESVAAGA